jgi:ubiquinone/menaquinone biosynthesis C-methylase UbiE
MEQHLTEPRTGFSDVDRSGRADRLVEYLGSVAGAVAALRRESLDALELRPGGRVLDVGCGAGEACVELAHRVGEEGRVAAIDLSEAMVDATRAAASAAGHPIDVHLASAYALPFPSATFDAVRSERVFQHLEDPELAITEMIRVLRPGGRLLILDPDHGQLAIAVDAPDHLATRDAVRRALLRMVVNPHSGSRLRGMMIRAGLEHVDQRIRPLEMSFALLRKALFIDDLLAAAVAAGEITQNMGGSFIAELERREAAGTFGANVVGYIVVGIKA